MQSHKSESEIGNRNRNGKNMQPKIEISQFILCILVTRRYKDGREREERCGYTFVEIEWNVNTRRKTSGRKSQEFSVCLEVKQENS